MLDAENPAEAAEQTTPTQDPEAGAAENPDQGGSVAPEGTSEAAAPAKKTTAKRTAKKATAKKATAKKATAKRTTKKAAASPAEPGEALFGENAEEAAVAGRPTPGAAQAAEAAEASATEAGAVPEETTEAPAKRTRKSTAKKTTAKRTTKKTVAAAAEETPAESPAAAPAGAGTAADADEKPAAEAEESATRAAPSATALLFQPPDPTKAVVTTRRRKPAKTAVTEEEAPEAQDQPQEQPPEKPAKKAAKKKSAKKGAEAKAEPAAETPDEPAEAAEAGPEGEEEQGGERRRRRRGGRRRRRSGGEDAEGAETEGTGEAAEGKEAAEEEGEEGAGTSRRRRRRRRGEGDGEEGRARKPRSAEDEITALSGSTRLEAKKQRRREGREAGRRRAPIVSEAEFLARRESVDRVMVIRQRQDLTQIAVLEDNVLVEHYVSRESQTSLIGNVYLGRVQNVLPSMEAAFIDIGKGRNAVLYAGEVNWDALGHKNGTPRKIESVLKSGQSILVQVTKDPIGHKGARLTSQVSLPGRFLVYVPDGTTSGISRKLPDTERNRLKTLLKEIVPESAGVIVRTAAEGASEEELTRDVERLTARWEDIEKKVKAGNAPQLLYGEPDLTLKVVRDLFTEDFKKLVIAGADAWDTVESYVDHVAPDLSDRLERYDGTRDVFAEYRIDEQIEKALDRKVWLPSGGSLVIDRTEAMTVVDVNTGKFTGSGGNLEETVTKNNLEAAEEIVRQLRLRDIGGIIVIDFIDMVLESNRDLVLRRLVECLGRDRTRHQVAEVTSLGLVQMTRKRIGTGLLEAFSESCEHCQGRGLVLHHEPVEPKKKGEDDSRRGRRTGRGRGRDQGSQPSGGGVPSPKDFAAMAKHEEAAEAEAGKAEAEAGQTETSAEQVSEPASAAKAETTEPSGEPAAPAALAEATEPSTEAGPSTEPSTEAGPSAEPKVTVRSRSRGRGRGRRAAAPAVEPGDEQTYASAGAGAVSADGQQPEPEPEPERGGAAEPGPGSAAETVDAQAPEAPAAPEVPAAPTVVTTVRRRSARRAAGPPSDAAATGQPVTGSGAAGSVSGSSGSGVELVDAEQVSDEPSDTDPVAPLVDSAELDGSDTVDTGPEAPATPHVPVKKRGSRRR